jgi:hypothetical protein
MPKPSSFSAKHWGREVQRGFDFYFASGRADLVVPKAAEIKQYFTSLAPTELELPKFMELDQDAQSRFDLSSLAGPPTSQAVAMASVSVIDLGQLLGASLVMADMRGGGVIALPLTQLAVGQTIPLAHLQNPCRVHAAQLEASGTTGLLVADLGSFLPADHQAGRVIYLRPTSQAGSPFETEVLLSGRGRVADVQAHDLDADGDLDIVVSDFGWHETGQLLWLERVVPGPAKADSFVAHVIDDRPGALESTVLDINLDGELDIVALISQEFEVIMAYLGDGRGGFQAHQLFSAEDPAFGSSGMHWLDVDRDGDVDCVLTNGDSFDSVEVKPYHSIHWLENRGHLEFVDHEIVRLPGVHEAVPCDLDGDQDIDIVAAAFLPRDLRSNLTQAPVGVLWLENDGSQEFKPHALQVGKCQHPALCTADLNGDGKLDIALANFYEDTADIKPAVDLMYQK